jgi:hypothetical protein
MRFALVDPEGSTIDAFDSYTKAREEIRTLLQSEPSLGNALLVVEFSDGQAAGAPRTAGDFAWPKVDPIVLQGLRRLPLPKVEVSSSSRDQAGRPVGIGTQQEPAMTGEDVAIGGLVLRKRHSLGGRY